MRPRPLFVLLLSLSAACRAEDAAPRYLGARGCRDCHSTKSIGDQYGSWKAGPHARAFADLGGKAAAEFARPLGISDPPNDARCTKCHVTAWDAPPPQKAYTFRPEDGVACEACHGPGELYSARDAMTNRAEATRKGLLTPTRETCLRCHNSDSPTYKGFDYEKALATIAHPITRSFAWDTSIAWQHDYEAALAQARAGDKPLLVDFHPGIGCPRCTAMRDVFLSPQVVAAAGDFVCVRIEAPTSAQLMQFGLSDCATRVAQPDGRPVKDLYGVVPPEVLAHVLLRAAQRKKGFPLDARDPRSKDVEEIWKMVEQRGLSSLEYAARRFVDLGRVCEPVLLKEIWNPDSPYRNQCIQILGHVEAAERKAGRAIDPAPGIDPFWDLLAFACDPSIDFRLSADEALVRLADPRSAELLARYGTNDVDARVAVAAFRAVAACRSPASVPWLLARVFEPHCPDPRCPVPLDAVVALGAIGDASAAEPLLQGMRGRPDLAPAILCALADMKSPRAVDAAITVLADRNQSFAARDEAVFAVSRCGDPSAWKRLLPFLSDPNVEIRGGICEAAGVMAPRDAIDPMLQVSREDPSEVPRAYAAWAAGKCAAAAPERKEEVIASLEGLLGDRSALVRVQALRALVGLGREELAFLLRDALRDHDTWNVEDRKALTLAAESLAERKDARAVEPLVTLLDERDLDTSRVAVACLEHITGEAQGHPGEVPLHLARTIFAAAGAEAVGMERRRILSTVEAVVPKWKKWLASQPHAATPAPAEGELEATLVSRVTGDGPAKETHGWLRIRTGASILRVTAWEEESQEPCVDRIVLVGRSPECAHGEGWEGADLASPHRCDGALWFRWRAGILAGARGARKVRVRVAAPEGTAERELSE